MAATRLIPLAVLALLVGGCSLTSSSASPEPALPHPQASISADYLPFLSYGPRQPRRHYTLRCGAAATGSYPRPAQACRALFTYLDAAVGNCDRGGYDGSATTDIHGTAEGRRVNFSIEASQSWCDQPLNVQRALWILSAFPCSVYVRTWPANFKGPVPSRAVISGRCARADGIPVAHG